MALEITQNVFVSLLGGKPIKILENDSSRVFVIIATSYTAGANSPKLCLAPDGGDNSGVLFLADQSNEKLRRRDYGELVEREMYIAEVGGGSPAGTFMVTSGSLI